MKVPSREECAALLREYGVPENVLKHTEQVRKVANFLAHRIRENGAKVDTEAVDKAALLHDMAKLYCMDNNCRHAAKAGQVLAARGYRGLGTIVRMHGLEEVNRFGPGTPIEARIVWYADKRVNHHEIVTMRERYRYLKQRYGSASREKMREILSTQANARRTENELLSMARTDEKLGGLNA